MKLQLILERNLRSWEKRGLRSAFSFCRAPFNNGWKPSLLCKGPGPLHRHLKSRCFSTPHAVPAGSTFAADVLNVPLVSLIPAPLRGYKPGKLQL